MRALRKCRQDSCRASFLLLLLAGCEVDVLAFNTAVAASVLLLIPFTCSYVLLLLICSASTAVAVMAEGSAGMMVGVVVRAVHKGVFLVLVLVLISPRSGRTDVFLGGGGVVTLWRLCRPVSPIRCLVVIFTLKVCFSCSCSLVY